MDSQKSLGEGKRPNDTSDLNGSGLIWKVINFWCLQVVCAYLNARDTSEWRPSSWRMEALRNEVNLSFLLQFRIKMRHNQILIISVFLANWEIVQTVDNSRSNWGMLCCFTSFYSNNKKAEFIIAQQLAMLQRCTSIIIASFNLRRIFVYIVTFTHDLLPQGDGQHSQNLIISWLFGCRWCTQDSRRLLSRTATLYL